MWNFLKWQAFQFCGKLQNFLRVQIPRGTGQVTFCHNNHTSETGLARFMSPSPPKRPSLSFCFPSLQAFQITTVSTHLCDFCLASLSFHSSFNFHFFPPTFTFYIFLCVLPPFLICWGVFSLSVSLVRSVPPALLNFSLFSYLSLALCELGSKYWHRHAASAQPNQLELPH